MVQVEILSDRRLSNLAQIWTSLRLLLTIENLYIYGDLMSLLVREDTENTEWLNLLRPFTAAKYLYRSKQFSGIALALQELTGGRITEVLPALQIVLSE